MSALLERLGVELPVVQAGMGGGLARHELAAAVSDAGGLGTIGTLGADELEREIAAARERTGRPIAVNLLLPFAHRSHWQAAAAADVVVTFWGRPRRRTAKPWLHQCGSVDEALAARAAGADGVIVQGVEAGGHVRGTTPALELLEQVRAAVGAGYPLMLAGGIADAADVRTALDAGADAAVLGTRFLMTDESRAHRAYKQRLMEARETVLSELFCAGWPRAPHRVIWNEAAERWLSDGGRVALPARAANTVLSPLLRHVPFSLHDRLAGAQKAALPVLAPIAVTDDRARRHLLDAGPLYAGESVARLHDLRPAGELVAELVQGRQVGAFPPTP